MSQGGSKSRSEAREARDGRALAVAGLLRVGWTAREVSAGLKIIDAGGSVEVAMATMHAARKARIEREGRS